MVDSPYLVQDFFHQQYDVDFGIIKQHGVNIWILYAGISFMADTMSKLFL